VIDVADGSNRDKAQAENNESAHPPIADMEANIESVATGQGDLNRAVPFAASRARSMKGFAAGLMVVRFSEW